MALTQSALELASSLSQNEIPIKLRCAICNRLATNAVRLPCCDQSICQSCQSTLPESCLVCEHSPLSADDCKPNKALRLTVKAFLKSEEKKRDKSRNESSSSKNTQQEQPASNAARGENDAPKAVDAHSGQGLADNNAPSTTSDLNVPKDAIDIVRAGQGNDKLGGQNEVSDVAKVTSGERDVELAAKDAENDSYAGDLANDADKERNNSSNGLVASEGMSNGQNVQFHGQSNYDSMQVEQSGMEWPNMGEYNPISQSQNGMSNMNWSWMPNMMGMEMDPMAMAQGYFGGFGGQGMGMNGMASGMNMNTMSLEGGFGGWQGQQGLGMNGQYGADAGYYSNNGYNYHHFQGHPYHRMHLQNSQSTSFQNKNFNRGRGRGFMHNNSSRGLPNRYRGHVNPRGFNESRNFVPNLQNASSQNVASRHGQGDAFFHQLPAGMQDGRASNQSPELAEAYRKQDMIINMHKGGDIPNADAKAHEGNEGNANIAAADITSYQSDKPDNANPTPGPSAIDHAGRSALSLDKTEQSNEIAGQCDSQAAMKLMPIESNSHERNEQIDSSSSVANVPKEMNGDSTAFNTLRVQQYQAANYYGPYRGRGNFYHNRGRGGYGEFRGNYRGRYGHAGGFSVERNGVDPQQNGLSEPIGTGVEGAPTGPKAMREGPSKHGFRGKDMQKNASKSDMPPPGPTRRADEDEYRRERSVSRSRENSPPDTNSESRNNEKRRYCSRSVSSTRRRPRQRDVRRSSETEERYDRNSVRRGSNMENDSIRNGPRSSNRDRSRSPYHSDEIAERQSSRREKEKYRSSRRYRESSANSERRQRRDSPSVSSRHYDEERRPGRSRDETSDQGLGRGSERVETSQDKGEACGRASDRTSAQDRERDHKIDRQQYRRGDLEQGLDRQEQDRKRSRRDRDESSHARSDDDEDEYRRRRRSKRSRRDEQHYSREDMEADGHADGYGDEKDGSIAPMSSDRRRETLEEKSSPVEVEFKIKNRSQRKRRLSSPSASAIPTGPAAVAKSAATTDPHTLEREARNRERLLKEVQRRQHSSQKQQQRSSKQAQQIQPQMRTIRPSTPPLHAPTGPAADKQPTVNQPPTEPSALRRSRKGSKRDSRGAIEYNNGNDYNDDDDDDIADGLAVDEIKENNSSSRRRDRHSRRHSDRPERSDRKERRRRSYRGEEYDDDRREEQTRKDRDRDKDGSSKRRNRDRDRDRDRDKDKDRERDRDKDRRSSKRAKENDETRTRRVESEREAARWR